MPAKREYAQQADTDRRGAPAGTRNLRPLLKGVFFFLSLAGLVVFVRVFDLQSVLDPAWADSHLHVFANGEEWKSMLLYISLVAVLSPVGVPRQALAALGGYAFGAVYGILFASVGLVCGCAAGFFYSRLLARDSLRPRFSKRVRQVENFLVRKPFAMTVALRLFPMGNNALLNLAAGLTRVPAPAFISGSCIGYLPQTVVFALLGSGIRIDPLWRTLVSALLFILATATGLALYRKYRGDRAIMDEAEHGGAAGQNSREPDSRDEQE